MTSRDEGEAEVLNDFLTSAFNRKPSYPLHIQPSEPEDRNREQNKVPTLQEKVVSELLCCPDMHKSRQMPFFCWELVKQPTKLHSPSFIRSPGELESSWVTGG